MLLDKKIFVVVPCYNEEKLIGKVLDSIPSFVDKIIVVDDKSQDKTIQEVKKRIKDNNIVLISHETNRGVGASITSGYKRALEEKADCVAVMAGDAQMDPSDLKRIVMPALKGQVEFVKGNRFATGKAWHMMPKCRYLGNSVLSLFTKIASGYWHVADSQTGYTAISADTLKRLELNKIYPRYGYPNDMLVKLNVIEATVMDLAVKPVYGIGETSGINIFIIVPKLLYLLFKLFLWRIKEKYIIRDFHPLIFFYFLSFLLIPPGLILGLLILYFNILLKGSAPLELGWLILCTLLLVTGVQSLFFAMWFDMEYNKNLCKYEHRL